MKEVQEKVLLAGYCGDLDGIGKKSLGTLFFGDRGNVLQVNDQLGLDPQDVGIEAQKVLREIHPSLLRKFVLPERAGIDY